jgi:hypothetical protein
MNDARRGPDQRGLWIRRARDAQPFNDHVCLRRPRFDAAKPGPAEGNVINKMWRPGPTEENVINSGALR